MEQLSYSGYNDGGESLAQCSTIFPTSHFNSSRFHMTAALSYCTRGLKPAHEEAILDESEKNRATCGQ